MREAALADSFLCPHIKDGVLQRAPLVLCPDAVVAVSELLGVNISVPLLCWKMSPGSGPRLNTLLGCGRSGFPLFPEGGCNATFTWQVLQLWLPFPRLPPL